MREIGREGAARFSMAAHLGALLPVLADAAGVPGVATPVDEAESVVA
jgi:hypothetical protein